MDDEADGLPKPSLFGTFMVAVETYGWFMLIGAFVLYYVYHKLRTQWPQVTRKLKNDGKQLGYKTKTTFDCKINANLLDD